MPGDSLDWYDAGCSPVAFEPKLPAMPLRIHCIFLQNFKLFRSCWCIPRELSDHGTLRSHGNSRKLMPFDGRAQKHFACAGKVFIHKLERKVLDPKTFPYASASHLRSCRNPAPHSRRRSNSAQHDGGAMKQSPKFKNLYRCLQSGGQG